MWSVTVEAEIPAGIDVEALEAFDSPESVQVLASDIVRNASENLNWKCGVITDISEAE